MSLIEIIKAEDIAKQLNDAYFLQRVHECLQQQQEYAKTRTSCSIMFNIQHDILSDNMQYSVTYCILNKAMNKIMRNVKAFTSDLDQIKEFEIKHDGDVEFYSALPIFKICADVVTENEAAGLNTAAALDEYYCEITGKKYYSNTLEITICGSQDIIFAELNQISPSSFTETTIDDYTFKDDSDKMRWIECQSKATIDCIVQYYPNTKIWEGLEQLKEKGFAVKILTED